MLGSASVSRLTWAAVLALLTACAPDSEPQFCASLCEREAACAAELGEDQAARQTACARSCDVLERDPERREALAARAACVRDADGCDEVRACAETGEGEP